MEEKMPGCDHLSLDLGGPDLVKPRRVGGGKMNANLGMISQEVVDELGLMGREIIGDHMGLESIGLGRPPLGQES